jgi:hypothetical protein
MWGSRYMIVEDCQVLGGFCFDWFCGNVGFPICNFIYGEKEVRGIFLWFRCYLAFSFS